MKESDGSKKTPFSRSEQHRESLRLLLRAEMRTRRKVLCLPVCACLYAPAAHLPEREQPSPSVCHQKVVGRDLANVPSVGKTQQGRVVGPGDAKIAAGRGHNIPAGIRLAVFLLERAMMHCNEVCYAGARQAQMKNKSRMVRSGERACKR